MYCRRIRRTMNTSSEGKNEKKESLEINFNEWLHKKQTYDKWLSSKPTREVKFLRKIILFRIISQLKLFKCWFFFIHLFHMQLFTCKKYFLRIFSQTRWNILDTNKAWTDFSCSVNIKSDSESSINCRTFRKIAGQPI